MKHCIWTYIDIDDFYETSCGNDKGFCFNDGGIKENKFRFCPYCGKIIKVKK